MTTALCRGRRGMTTCIAGALENVDVDVSRTLEEIVE